MFDKSLRGGSRRGAPLGLACRGTAVRTLAGVILFAALWYGCGDSTDPVEVFTLSVAPSDTTVAAAAGSIEVRVKSNTAWTVSHQSDWFTVVPAEGDGDQMLVVSFAENEAPDERADTITVSAGDLSEEIRVAQTGATILVIAPTDTTVAAAGSLSVSITSNTNWTISSLAGILSLNESEGSGDGTVMAAWGINPSEAPRVDTVRVTAGDLTREMTFTQAGGALSSDSISLSATRDNTIFEESTPENSISNGSGQFLFSGRTKLVQVRRCLLAFELEGKVPAGSRILSATLTLHMSRTIVGSESFGLHRLLSDWGEGDSDAGGNEGRGIAAESSDATWDHSFFNTTTWLTPGGDFEPVASGVTAVGGSGSYSWSDSLMAVDLQSWVDDPDSNFGWLLSGNETRTTAKRFDSRENPNAANRPVLMIEFRVPGP